MKQQIHPHYQTISVVCASCGNSFETGSTLGHNLQADVCSNCHPFYTGKHRILDSSGRIERFRAKYAVPAATAG